ncbi:unnamed protein product [Ilex paraguariensis]|uniref:Uncharacterized protein n=1 Tax=Ilex paraguariensis TaxID=185542 RepID=A0ABC8SKA9_9AQUA
MHCHAYLLGTELTTPNTSRTRWCRNTATTPWDRDLEPGICDKGVVTTGNITAAAGPATGWNAAKARDGGTGSPIGAGDGIVCEWIER